MVQERGYARVQRRMHPQLLAAAVLLGRCAGQLLPARWLHAVLRVAPQPCRCVLAAACANGKLRVLTLCQPHTDTAAGERLLLQPCAKDLHV